MGEIAAVEAFAAVYDAAPSHRARGSARLRPRSVRRRPCRSPAPSSVSRRVGIAHADLRGRRVQRRDKIGEHRVFDVDARACRAFLPGQPERRTRNARSRRSCRSRMPRDDRRVLAAHFQHARPRPAAVRERAIEMHADAVTPRERDAGHVRMPDQRLAERAAGPGHEIEHARRQARIAQCVRQQPPAPRRGGRGLEHDGVARRQRGTRRDRRPAPAGN